ncbi:MAG: hypothetical protein ACE37I_11845 [Rubinisphaera brasiliensis]|uniref:DUF4345 domain-containing protein n=1 Tax=Rubinisphaera brasiliensis (strain ATCC 49424 / DSM 5305 / JCM 21570 / IAM 15109 / NBRC 103401 / IFAM 1448) TaxID=756272 RepID=F0SIM9_RUBBR|nr:hypothetical protein [Rubinisphaera brasiliensis]ADY59657.1 hypothetical protein Plabr_2053 [Rubinisphaera brasiliensis DSM 5305]MBB02874.1 hypothetical protein [Planctomyces sp.]MBR9803281.1 hypothetical protein [bacterium]
MVAKIFLTLTGLMYAGLALYCTIAPGKASDTVNLGMNGMGGKSEFTTVYGGLEMGMALVFLMPLLQAGYTKSSLLACLLIHGCLVAFRLFSFTQYPGAFQHVRTLAIGEIVILLLSIAVWFGSSFNTTPVEG